MALGIISIVTGIVFLVLNFFRSVELVNQQIVQYLGYLIGSIFIVGGFVILALRNYIDELVGIIGINNKISKSYIKTETKRDNPPPINKTSGDWVCKKCSQENSSANNICKGCGEYR